MKIKFTNTNLIWEFLQWNVEQEQNSIIFVKLCFGSLIFKRKSGFKIFVDNFHWNFQDIGDADFGIFLLKFPNY